MAPMLITSPIVRRAQELAGVLRQTDGPNDTVDRLISHFYGRELHPTQSLDCANRMVPRFHQRGGREHPNGGHSAYVEVNAVFKQGFAWANHKSSYPIALAIAALESYVEEMIYGGSRNDVSGLD